ncbi:MAG: hypothetical protein A2341_04245 [Deltaproteobacteria bacterium RIFOXYB12_FULL_58_9]|nr:MAG: hypothetical protein A2341_04245 [Deltaproteobacteria bacterium RIFOXYB12_FULL_58_9]
MTAEFDFIAHVKELGRVLDTLDYFQILVIHHDASMDTVRAAYHERARFYHPDRYHHLGVAELTTDLTRISKRITEAYVTLRDSHKRACYLLGIQSPGRASKLRYSEADEQKQKDEREAESGKTPQVKQFYNSAKLAHTKGDRAAAIKSIKMAIAYEPDNANFKELLEQWQNEPKAPQGTQSGG